MPIYNHLCSLGFTIRSKEMDGSDITSDEMRIAVQERMKNLKTQADIHEAILPPEDSFLEHITQAEFRENADQCVNCQAPDIEGTGLNVDGNYIYQSRQCLCCGARWRVSFKADSFVQHSQS